MRFTSKNDVLRAISRGYIEEGMRYTNTCGIFIITELTTNPWGHSVIIGKSAECYESGEIGEATNITACDLINCDLINAEMF